jgi:hypothetical protein
MVSWGGFTFGIALPPTALTVDTHEYIGFIVSVCSFVDLFPILICLDWLNSHKQGRLDWYLARR